MIKRNSKGEYVLISYKSGRVLGRYKERQTAINKEAQLKSLKLRRRRRSGYA